MKKELDIPFEIKPQSTTISGSIGELIKARKLIKYFALDALKRLYRRTILGVFWLFVRPTTLVIIPVVMYLFILQVKVPGPPYILFFLSGFLPWVMFDFGVMWVTRSLNANAAILQKMYLPKLIFPISFAAPGVLYAAVTFLALIGAILWYWVKDGTLYINFSFKLILLFVSVFWMFLIALGVGFFTCIWGAVNRDVRFIIRYVNGALLLLTPVAFSTENLPINMQWLTNINILAQPIFLARLSLFGDSIDLVPFVSSIMVTIMIFMCGLSYFLKYEKATMDKT